MVDRYAGFSVDRRSAEKSSAPDAQQVLAALLAVVDHGRASRWADGLIAAFGTVGGVLAASPIRLARLLEGNQAAVSLLVAQRHTMMWVLRERALRRPLVATRHAVLRYLHQTMAHDGQESLRVFFVNGRREVIAEEVMAYGSPDALIVEPRQILVRALELHATGLILVHNHPSGDPAPSVADRRFTQRLALAGNCLGIHLHDHLVVARDGTERIEVTFSAIG